MRYDVRSGGRKAAVALTAPALLLTCSVSSSAAPVPTARLAAGAEATAGSPALHTFKAIAVGVPGLSLPGNNEGGAVDLFLPDGTVQVLTELKLGLIGEDEGTFDRFGSAVVIANLNGDAHPDLVVGAPGSALDGSTPGHIDVLLGSADGITGPGATMLPSPASKGDEFGAAIAVSGNSLWVGAPGSDTGGLKDSGAVYRYEVSPTGQATLKATITAATPGVPGARQAGARFGEVLAPAVRGVIVGIPKQDVGSAAQAGQIVQLKLSDQGALSAEGWTQNSAGVPGTAEAGDNFGAAVSPYGQVVGAPGEDVGTVKNAGGVQTFRPSGATGTLVPGYFQTQDSKGIPGAAEAGDRYGASVAMGIFDCQEAGSMAVGAPGEDLGKATNAGSVTLSVLIKNDVPCPARVLSQGKGLPGSPETGDAVGTAVALAEGNLDMDEDKYDTLMVGAPGEDVGAGRAGLNVGRATVRTHRGTTQSFGLQSGDWRNVGYGSVFGS